MDEETVSKLINPLAPTEEHIIMFSSIADNVTEPAPVERKLPV